MRWCIFFAGAWFVKSPIRFRKTSTSWFTPNDLLSARDSGQCLSQLREVWVKLRGALIPASRFSLFSNLLKGIADLRRREGVERQELGFKTFRVDTITGWRLVTSQDSVVIRGKLVDGHVVFSSRLDNADQSMPAKPAGLVQTGVVVGNHADQS